MPNDLKIPKLLALKRKIAGHADEILTLFKPGAKITIVVTNDGYGDAGVIVSNDEISRVIKELAARTLENPLVVTRSFTGSRKNWMMRPEKSLD